MKCSGWILFLMTFPMHLTMGQVDSSLFNSLSIGISAGQFGEDPGIGIEIGSPTFLGNHVLLRINGSLAWMEEYKASQHHWAKYNIINACVAYNFKPVERVRPYLQVGTTFIFPQQEISDTGVIKGLNYSAGLELFLASKPGFHICYYFSLGYSHINAHADNLESNPLYSNGLIFNNGFRFYLSSH
jgi:hypothetical protein